MPKSDIFFLHVGLVKSVTLLYRDASGCVKLGEKVAFCFPSEGRKTQFFHLMFIQPGAHLLEHPCRQIVSESVVATSKKI